MNYRTCLGCHCRKEQRNKNWNYYSVSILHKAAGALKKALLGLAPDVEVKGDESNATEVTYHGYTTFDKDDLEDRLRDILGMSGYLKVKIEPAKHHG